MNLRSVDLNLLPVFEAIFAEGSVTAAAARVGMSQPALSEALGRLRHVFGDPLFVRHGGRMSPTRKAVALAEPIAAALAGVRTAFDGGRFDPATTQRVFRLGLGDYAETVILPALAERLAGLAPGIGLRTVATTPSRAVLDLDRGEIEAAIDVFPRDTDARFVRTRLLEEHAVCLAQRGMTVDLASYLSVPHVVRSPTGDTGVGVVEEALSSLGLKRTIKANVAHVLALPLLLQRVPLIATQPSRVAHLLSLSGAVEVHEAPIPIATWTVDLITGPGAIHDPGTVWLVGQIRDLCRDL